MFDSVWFQIVNDNDSDNHGVMSVMMCVPFLYVCNSWDESNVMFERRVVTIIINESMPPFHL